MNAACSRRGFLAATGALAATRLTAAVGDAPASAAELGFSPPVLQNAAETSIGVMFTVTASASGWVDCGERADLSDARRYYSGAQGMMTIDDRIALVRITGLKPATRYYYRIGADRIDYSGGYAMKNLGAKADPAVHSFTTLGAAASGSFAVINDTHASAPALDLVLGKLAGLRPSVAIWNGDASNTSETLETSLGIFVNPHPKHPGYAADTPFMFLNGNHDYRGRFNRRLHELMMYRETAERPGRFADLGRNFVQRLGDIALIGLDTGEDKLDTNPRFAGVFRMQEYRERQAEWLKEALAGEAVRTAKFRVAFCHIPLFDSNPKANPGDVAPADSDPSKYTHDFAIWQRTCAGLWGPLLKAAGCQLVIAAHQHEFRFDPATEERGWAQIVGGGPELDGTGFDGLPRFPTVIEGSVEGGRLCIRVYNAVTGCIAGEFVFNPGC